MKKEEIFVVGFHEWCMYTGFPGFNDASYKEKIAAFKRFLHDIPKRPVGHADPFFNVGLMERQNDWDKKYKIFTNPI